MAGKTRRGRPPGQRTATAYDYRRVIALVQVLAIKDYGIGLYQLADAWGVEIPLKRIPEIGLPMHDMQELVHKLAQHALEQAREERE